MNELLELIGNIQDCPWAKWRPATLHFCEAHACAWIATPAEFWSNLAYLLVAVYLLVRGVMNRRAAGGLLLSIPFRFGLYALITGICSGLFHASHTFVFETFDLAAMFLLGIEMIVQNISRLGWFKGNSPIAFALVVFFGSIITLVGTVGSERLFIFSAMATIAAYFEILIFIRSRRLGVRIDYTPLIQSWALFGVSFAFWLADYTGKICVPERHTWSGHALWHVLNAGCFLTLSRFYSGVTLARGRAAR